MPYFPWIAGGAALGLAARRGRRAPRRLGHKVVAGMVEARLKPFGIHVLCDVPQRPLMEGESLYLYLYGDVYGEVETPWNPAWGKEHRHFPRSRELEHLGWSEFATVRISDHMQPAGGGFNVGQQRRHGASDWSIDPSTTIHPLYGQPMSQQERIEVVVREAREKLAEDQEEWT